MWGGLHCSTALQPLHSAVALWQSITLYSTLGIHTLTIPTLQGSGPQLCKITKTVCSSDRALYSVKGSGFSISFCHVSQVQTNNIQRLSQKSMFSSDPRSMKQVNNVRSTYFIQRIHTYWIFNEKKYTWKHINTIFILKNKSRKKCKLTNMSHHIIRGSWKNVCGRHLPEK